MRGISASLFALLRRLETNYVDWFTERRATHWWRQAAASSLHLDEDGGFPRLWVAIETLHTQNGTGGWAALFHLVPFSASAILHRRQRETRGSALTTGNLFYCAASPSKKMCQTGQSDFTVTLLAMTLQCTKGSRHSFNLFLYIHLSVELIHFLSAQQPRSSATALVQNTIHHEPVSWLFQHKAYHAL